MNHTKTPQQVAVYQVEPYVVGADVYGESPQRGRGGWTWYTGSAGWMYRVALESVLGITIAHGDTLQIKPCIPDHWDGFVVRYRVPNVQTTYEIEVRNPTHKASCVVAATIDGEHVTIENGMAFIPLSKDNVGHQVFILLRDA